MDVQDAIDFPRHARGDGKRFHVRALGNEFQVHGALDMRHVAMCATMEMAVMVQHALECVAEMQESIGMFTNEDH